MKIPALIVLLSLIFLNSVFGQICPNANYILNNQTDIDGMVTVLASCDEISGNLIIDGTNTVHLNGLGGLKKVDGDVVVSNNASLADILGLFGLETVGGTFEIDNNASMNSLPQNAFPLLVSVGDFFSLEEWSNLTVVGDNIFPSLLTIGNSFSFEDLKSIVTFKNGFDNLQSIQSHFNMRENTNLSYFTGFKKLKLIGGNFNIEDSGGAVTSLKSVVGFNSLESIGAIHAFGGDFNLDDNNLNLESIKGFEKLKTIAGNFNVDNLPKLKSIEGFNSLETLFDPNFPQGNFNLYNNQSLQLITGFENLSTVKFDFNLYNNPLLFQCCVFYNFLENGTLGGSINIHSNAAGCSSESEILALGECLIIPTLSQWSLIILGLCLLLLGLVAVRQRTTVLS